MAGTRPRHASRCAEIIETARGLLLGEGLDAFAMRTVAASAGMRLGNLQYYFATRDDLLEAVIRAEITNDLTMVEGSLRAEDAVRDVPELARQLVENWSSGTGGVYLSLASLAYHSDRFRALNREVYESFYAAIGSLVRRIDPDAALPDVRIRAQLMTSLLDGTALQLHAAVHTKAESDALIERAAALLAAIAADRQISP
ncbi:TetR/AcrR family transcriptional regulator [Planobispora longispora]|uniref:HTH tetR-type domain-containing protein n=1 Tax=Planobispora longispora TaxID=28887 RepID=A0A8J3REA4_9ACTN|nr:TetR/AcrR family transcriptional regulator [Planobispora longispora]BFE86974.1 hypothetical protein GCM10020093_095750 [Planobispora longispora]GIH74651.1 hypothetical protein Plo01_10800 [Planobispora longispora]